MSLKNTFKKWTAVSLLLAPITLELLTGNNQVQQRRERLLTPALVGSESLQVTDRKPLLQK